MRCDATMNAISMESTWIGLIIDRIERYIEDTVRYVYIDMRNSASQPAIQPACSTAHLIAIRMRVDFFVVYLFLLFFYYFYEWQSKIVQHINRSNWIKADPPYIICDTHTNTLAHSHIVTLSNLRFGRYVFGGILAKRICSNSVRYCYLPALDCSNNNNA